ncbi:MAG: hypothetical protein ACLTEJ_13635 [Neglectibacter timonensis]
MERISWKPEERRGLVAGNASISGDVSPRGEAVSAHCLEPALL